MQLQGNMYEVGSLRLGYPKPNNGECSLVVHSLTSPSHRRQTERSLEYITELKVDVANQRANGRNVVWMLDAGTDSGSLFRAAARSWAYARKLGQYDTKVARNLETQLKMISDLLGIEPVDSYLITEYRDPLRIFTGLLSRKMLFDLLRELKPESVHISGETYSPNHPEDVEAHGCINNVVGACLKEGILFEKGPVLLSTDAF